MEFIDLKTQYKTYKEEIDKAIHEVLDSTQFVMGPAVVKLEEELAAYAGVKHCIGASSGTDTLLIALMALDIGPGDEVITTPFTFISTAEVIKFLGAKPVFVDIDLDTYNINPDLIEAAITPKTKAIMPVGLFGHMPDLKKINAIAEKHGIPVIEDAAQSFGAEQDGVKSCGGSTFGSTSFFPAKPLGGYGDGGALFTNDDALAEKCRAIRVHGGVTRHEYQYVGLNGRLDTIQAAVLRVKLSHFNDELAARERIGARYNEQLKDLFVTPTTKPGFTHTYAIYTLRSKNRETILKQLSAAGIPSPIYYPRSLHEQIPFQDLGYSNKDFPNTMIACSEIFSVPMHPFLSEQDQDKVIQVLKQSTAVVA